MNKNYSELDEVLVYIHNHLDDNLPLSHLASQAAYSPFHFSRIFKEKTGMSPHQYVSSLKIQRAKSLLINTDLTVRDISMEVNQQSVGTFTTRFTERVGMTPKQFRKSSGQVKMYLQTLKNQQGAEEEFIGVTQTEIVEGSIKAEVPLRGVILIGLFNKPVPEGLPQYGKLLTTTGTFRFTGVRPGTYYLMAAALRWDMNINELLVPHQTLRAKADQPVQVIPGMKIPAHQLTLRGPQLGDPPILISLPLLIKNYLHRINSKG